MMIWRILKSLLMLSFWTSICCVQICWAAYRVIRSSNSSIFIHHELELQNNPRFEKISKEMDMCTNISDYSEQNERWRRSNILTTTESVEIVNETKLDTYFYKCNKIIVEFGCYEIFPNKSVHVPTYKKQFKLLQYYIYPHTKELFICSDYFKEIPYVNSFSLKTTQIVLLVSIAISAFFMILYGVAFIVCRKLKNLLGYCIFYLSIALLLAYLCTAVVYFGIVEPDCSAMGIIEAFANLGYFFWLNIMSYDIWRSLKMATAKRRLTDDRPMLTRFAMYSAYAWGVPAFITVFGIIAGNELSCWFYYKRAVLFVTPLLLLLPNILLFMLSICRINKSEMNEAENKGDLWSGFFLTFSLAGILEFEWVFRVPVLTFTGITWNYYISAPCYVLVGVLILFSFPIAEKIRKLKGHEERVRVIEIELEEMGADRNAIEDIRNRENVMEYKKSTVFNCSCHFHLEKLFSLC
ncbi:G-protein coupled receptor Mth2-like [Argiope bruennichi]|uniref:Putative G-protein coupled receptor Mth-like n=1 Tax=Argiope bruennichi TaxID=94029 RepID=A0A8T0EM98_ARGBR|nr:G-protein coupled receptor Mth2-like [Argiope bruennichi]KAF8777013.1 putative G-protein coupled receptor Mth-like [Argiope bruennichi]